MKSNLLLGGGKLHKLKIYAQAKTKLPRVIQCRRLSPERNPMGKSWHPINSSSSIRSV